MNTNENIQVLLNAGAAAAEVRWPGEGAEGEIPFLAIPDDYRIADLESLLPAPARKRAEVTMTDAPSFIAYTMKHGSMDECVIYADIDTEASRCRLVAVMNDHGADAAQWRDHRCTFAPALSVEWKRWISKNGQPMSQANFAAWLEENLPDIASVPNMPTGADILAMALGFEANADKRLRSKINLQSGGVTFEFVDDEDKDTRTRMQVFERFTLGLPVFEGSSSAYPLEARLKYREKEGKVTFWFELVRHDRVFKTAVADELKAIKDATGFLMLNGKP